LVKKKLISIFLGLILDRIVDFVEFGVAVGFFLEDAAKKGFSSFSHIVVVVPFFELAELLDSDLHFFGSLKIRLELQIIWFRQKGRQSQACRH
jgi:hypothetical protein